MQDEQVDLIDAELSGALLEAVQRLLVAVVADPDLRLQEDLGPVQLGGVNRLATSRSFPYAAAVSICR